MSYIDEISNFLEDYSGVLPEDPNIDIWKDMGVKGDDFHEMMDNYSKLYEVDLSNYLWYFHTDEEGYGIGGLLSKPPYERVERIPVTPQMLADFIVTKKWNIDYPPHVFPEKRIDLKINVIVTILIAIGMCIYLFYAYF